MGSSLYLELSKEALSKVIAAALRTDVVSFRLLTGGLFNTTYFVETAGSGPVVLRVGPVNRHLLMPFEHRLMETEVHVGTLFAQYGVPCSEILATDTSRTVIDRDFMIVRYIPSRAMYGMELLPQDWARICREIGAATAKMHAIQSPRFGRIADVKDGAGFASWSEALYHELIDWERVGVPSGLFTQEEHREIRSLFQRAAPCLDEIREPRLVHADLWLGNILIRTDTERPEFAAIIDADRALWGDPMFDFSSIRWTHAEEDFWAGYGKIRPQDTPDQIRCAVYTLLNRLWNAYVYEREYNEPQNAIGERDDALKQMSLLRALL